MKIQVNRVTAECIHQDLMSDLVREPSERRTRCGGALRGRKVRAVEPTV